MRLWRSRQDLVLGVRPRRTAVGVATAVATTLGESFLSSAYMVPGVIGYSVPVESTTMPLPAMQ